MIPDGAVYECEIAGGVALYDVTQVLPRHAARRYAKRDPAGICRVYHHHSGAKGKPGYEGARNSARYVTRDRKNRRGKLVKGWPGFAYTYWLATDPDVDSAGRLVVYRCNDDSTRSYHTGVRANGHGVGVAWQGNLTKLRPSPYQVEMSEALCAWLMQRHDLAVDRPFSFHAEAGDFGGKPKATCPGPHVTAWVKAWRGDGEGDGD